MQDSIKVFAPATVANVGCGFDIMGFALDGVGEEIVMNKTNDGRLRIKPVVDFEDIPTEPENNVATVAVKAMLEQLDIEQGFEFEFFKHIKPGSGLGTSASSSAGAVFGVNELLGNPFRAEELVAFAMEGEKLLAGKAHGDNAAPALLGGFQLIRYDPLEVLSIPFPIGLWVTIVHPQVEIKTSEARKMLRTEIPMTEAITQWGNVAGLISGLHSGNMDLIGRSLQDVIVEPVRSQLIPEFDRVKQAAIETGGLGCSIAGSGPAVFAFSKEASTARAIEEKMSAIYSHAAVDFLTYVSKIGKTGARIII